MSDDERRRRQRSAYKKYNASHVEERKALRKRTSDRYRESGKMRLDNIKSNLKKQYGITVETYDALLSSQSGLCAICQNPPQASAKQTERLAVDHDHGTGLIRGLLCHRCNMSLGGMRDSVALMERAIEYLKKHGSA